MVVWWLGATLPFNAAFIYCHVFGVNELYSIQIISLWPSWHDSAPLVRFCSEKGLVESVGSLWHVLADHLLLFISCIFHYY